MTISRHIRKSRFLFTRRIIKQFTSKRNTSNTRHTESLNYSYLKDEASRHTHTQTKGKEKGDFPFCAVSAGPLGRALSWQKWRPTLAAAHTPSSISSSEPSSNNPSKGPSSNRFSYTHSPLFPQHSSRSAASLSASPSTDTDSRRGTSALDPLPLHTLRSLSDNPVRFLRGPASFSRPTPLLGVPPPSPPIGPADTPPARQRHRGAWHGAREIIPPEEAPTFSGIGRSGRCG